MSKHSISDHNVRAHRSSLHACQHQANYSPEGNTQCIRTKNRSEQSTGEDLAIFPPGVSLE